PGPSAPARDRRGRSPGARGPPNEATADIHPQCDRVRQPQGSVFQPARAGAARLAAEGRARGGNEANGGLVPRAGADLVVLPEQVVIARRFSGPPDSAHGGYACAMVARYIDGTAEVSLRSPPPLERPLAVERAA